MEAPPDAREERTQRTAGQSHLVDSEQRFRLLVESVKDYAIFMLDPTGHVATWNVGAERIKGYSASEIVGQHFSRFYPPEAAKTGICERELEAAVEEGRFEDEGWRVRKDGTHFWANVVITPLRDRSGQLVGFAKVTRDLTQRRRLEQERLRLFQAQEAIRLRDEFLSIVSHELRTPLAALQLQLENLRQKVRKPGESLVPRVEKALRSSLRLGDLIDTLLDVSRIATGRLELNREALDLASIVKEAVDSLRPAAEKAECEIRTRISGDLNGMWDPVRTEQVVVNLLSNAIKYGAGCPIDVSLRRQGDEAVLEVSDRGPGISGEDLIRIFERFERAASVRKYGGLGLGLYVAREVAVAHGGTVTVDNRSEGGVCFRVGLPLLPLTDPVHAPLVEAQR